MKRVLLFAAATVLANAGNVFAYDVEFYTYGGFDAIYMAFQKIALVFSDDGYKTLMTTAIILGIGLAGLATYLRALSHGTGTMPLGSWLVPVCTGIVVWIGLFGSYGTVHVYDPVKNRYEPVAGVPDGITLTVGNLNRIERLLIELVDTAGDPRRYRDSAGGLGPRLLWASARTRLTSPDSLVDRSISRYIYDCVFWDIKMGNISQNEILSDNNDFVPLFALAQHPSNFTVWWSDNSAAERQGIEMSCTQAWGNISAYLNQADVYDDMTREICSNAGFDVEEATELNRCTDTLQYYVGWLTGEAIGATAYVRQQYLSWRLQEAPKEGNAKFYGDYLMGIQAEGSYQMTDEWVPAIRAVLTSFMIAIIPFLLLFLPTPISGLVIKTIMGMFVFLVSWGVGDAMVHQYVIDQAYNTFESVRQHRLGLEGLSGMVKPADEVLTMYAAFRSKTIMFAAFVAFGLLKVGGHAFASMAGSLQGAVDSQGAAGATKTQTPEGQASAIKAVPTSMAYRQVSDEFDPRKWSTAEANRMAASIGGGSAYDGMGDARAIGAQATEMAIGKTEGAYKAFSASGSGSVRGAAAQSAGQATTKQVSGFQQDRDVAQEMGYGDNMAEFYQAERGAKINLAKDGGLTTVTAGAGGKILMTQKSGVYSKGSMAGKIQEFRKAGLTNAAEGLDKIWMPMSSSESAVIKETRDGDGNLAMMSVSMGGQVDQFDTYSGKWKTSSDTQDTHRSGSLATHESGRRSWEGKRSVREDRDETQISRGLKVDPDTAWQMAKNADSNLYQPINEDGVSGDQQDTRMWAVASKVSAGMIMKEEGIDADSAQIGAGGNLIFFKGGVQAESVSREKVDVQATEIYNLMKPTAESGDLNSGQRNAQMALDVSEYVSEKYDNAETEQHGPKNIVSDNFRKAEDIDTQPHPSSSGFLGIGGVSKLKDEDEAGNE